MKKIILLLVACLILAGVLCGCHGKDTDTATHGTVDGKDASGDVSGLNMGDNTFYDDD